MNALKSIVHFFITLMILPTVTFLIWFGASTFQIQWIIDGGIYITRMLFEGLAKYSLLNDWATNQLEQLPTQVNTHASNVNDMGLFRVWLVWAVIFISIQVIYLAVKAVLRWSSSRSSTSSSGGSSSDGSSSGSGGSGGGNTYHFPPVTEAAAMLVRQKWIWGTIGFITLSTFIVRLLVPWIVNPWLAEDMQLPYGINIFEGASGFFGMMFGWIFKIFLLFGAVALMRGGYKVAVQTVDATVRKGRAPGSPWTAPDYIVLFAALFLFIAGIVVLWVIGVNIFGIGD